MPESTQQAMKLFAQLLMRRGEQRHEPAGRARCNVVNAVLDQASPVVVLDDVLTSVPPLALEGDLPLHIVHRDLTQAGLLEKGHERLPHLFGGASISPEAEYIGFLR